MQKRSLIFSMVLILTLLLSACAGGDNQGGSETGVPFGTGVPGGTGEPGGIPDTGEMPDVTSQSTPGIEPTQVMETDEAPTSEATEAVTDEAEATEVGTPGADGTNQAPAGQGADSGLIGIPQTGSGLVGLAAMQGWQVVGSDGGEIGTVQDSVINMCEAHILYLVVEPSADMGIQGSQQILVPYEAVLGELNEGSSVDVMQGVFTLKQNAADLIGVPGIDVAKADLQNPDWSQDVQSYWSGDYRLSMTAGCNVPVSGNDGTVGSADQQAATITPGTEEAGTPAATEESAATPAATNVTPTEQDGQNADRQTIYRLALASQVLNASLQEGNGTELGMVRDAAIVPETGRTQFFVVETGTSTKESDSMSMVALPPGAVNVSYEDSTSQPVLVLLVETPVLQGAPAFDANTNTTDENWMNYWSQYIPMTREQLP